MPEMLTKYPDIALQVLKDAHISCGKGAKQQILTTCPRDQFCALPTGELCIYGIKQIPNMTQIHTLDVFQLSNAIFPTTIFIIMVFLLGMLAGIKIKK